MEESLLENPIVAQLVNNLTIFCGILWN